MPLSISFDTSHPELTRRNRVTRPDVGLHVAKAPTGPRKARPDDKLRAMARQGRA
jgi:hypothetical protein